MANDPRFYPVLVGTGTPDDSYATVRLDANTGDMTVTRFHVQVPRGAHPGVATLQTIIDFLIEVQRNMLDGADVDYSSCRIDPSLLNKDPRHG